MAERAAPLVTPLPTPSCPPGTCDTCDYREVRQARKDEADGWNRHLIRVLVDGRGQP